MTRMDACKKLAPSKVHAEVRQREVELLTGLSTCGGKAGRLENSALPLRIPFLPMTLLIHAKIEVSI